MSESVNGGAEPQRDHMDPLGGMQGVWWALHSPAQGALLEASLAAVRHIVAVAVATLTRL